MKARFPIPEMHVTSSQRLPVLAAMVCLIATPLLDAAEPDRLVTLEGEDITGIITGIDQSGAVTVENNGTSRQLELDRLRSIRRTVKQEIVSAPVVIELSGGGQLQASALTIRDQALQVRWRFGEFSIPVETARALLFAPRKSDIFRKAESAPLEDMDQIFFSIAGKLQSIRGIVESLDKESLSFDWKGEVRSMPRENLHGVVLAAIGPKPELAGSCLVDLVDGSAVWGKVRSLEDSQLKLAVSKDSILSLPWGAVMGLNVRSTRMVFLSDLDPLEVEEAPVVTLARSWQRDRSAGGRALTLAGKVYSKGIGVHARSRLVFPASKYDLLAATIGIDDETNGRGDCLFIVQGDGRELFRQRVTAKDDPRDVRVSLEGVKRVTLLVEPGEQLDLADHADWCDVRLIRERPQ